MKINTETSTDIGFISVSYDNLKLITEDTISKTIFIGFYNMPFNSKLSTTNKVEIQYEFLSTNIVYNLL